MRSRYLIPILLAAPVALIACDDGPAQPFDASPEGAAMRWNNGREGGVTDDASAPFTTMTGGNNRQEICTGEQKHARWAQMVQEPIAPPRHGAGLDLAGDDTWRGLTIDAAEQINCQSVNDGDQFGDGSQVNQWGDNGEVWVEYSVQTRKIDAMTLWNGYLGKMTFHSPDGMHSYILGLGTQIQKDGRPFTLNWLDETALDAALDELYRGILHEYSPGLPQDPAGTTCAATGHCIHGSFGDVAYFYMPVLGFGFWIDSQNAAQPVPSTPTRIDLFPAKVLPFAFANPRLELDQDGPIANAGALGTNTMACDLRMGITYGEFLRDCVQVAGNTTADTQALNMLLGGISHSTERFSFDVQGVDLNFTDDQLPAMDIIHDQDRPSMDDTATELSIDQSTLGNIQNDLDASGNLDLHGTGAVYREYARLARSTLLGLAGVADGDVTQCLYPRNPPADFDESAWLASLPAWCTGFEGFLTPAQPTGPTDVNNLGLDVLAVDPAMALGLKLGHESVAFCFDANGDVNTGYRHCRIGDTFPTSYQQVLHVMGRDNVLRLPTDARDIRFFFKIYTQALVKHLLDINQPDLSRVTLDYDDLFFDAVGSGQFEIAEYVDRRFASPTQPPTDFEFIADVRNGIFDLYDFSRDLYRGESALYAATLENQQDGIGQENTALLTNLFGSPVLKNGWVDSSTGRSAYYCATHMDPRNCDGQVPPLDANGNMLLDANGRPVLEPYPGAFTGTAFSLGPSPIALLETYPNIQQAMVRVPLHQDPYDLRSASRPPLTVLVPWVPKQPGEGFPVALNGTLDKFIETAQLDFSGTTITANVDYDFVLDPDTHQPTQQIQFLAVETTDFLGDVFLCQDPRTGDVLSARMYSPVATILDWLDTHPGTTDSCGIVIRYSPYGNFVDFITSLTNGVRLGVTQGGGFGRVVDATLFVPGQ